MIPVAYAYCPACGAALSAPDLRNVAEMGYRPFACGCGHPREDLTIEHALRLLAEAILEDRESAIPPEKETNR